MGQKIGQYVYHTIVLPRWTVEITVAEDALGVLWYPIRPLCIAMGLDPSAQMRVIHSDGRLEAAHKKVPIPFGANFTNAQNAVCLPYRPDRGEVSALAIWFLGIDPGRVKLDTRGTLEEFQYDVLSYATQILFAKRGHGAINVVTPQVAVARDRGREVRGEVHFECPDCGSKFCLVLEEGKVHILVADEIPE